MFYDETKIKQLLICSNCKSPLVNAYMIPCCGESVCGKCLPESKSGQKCAHCSKPIDQNNNYQPNKALNRLIDLQPTELNQQNQLNQNTKVNRDEPQVDAIGQQLAEIRRQYELLVKTLEKSTVMAKIADYCNQLQKKIRARTELTQEQVKAASESILSQIDAYQRSCEISFHWSGVRMRFDERLSEVRSELDEFEKRIKEMGSGQKSVGLDEKAVDRLRLGIESMKMDSMRRMFTGEMLEYHECPRATLGCILMAKKLSPTYAELKPLRINEDLLDASDLLFTYFQIGFLHNGQLVLSVSDGDIFKSIYIIDLTKCESTCGGYLVKKLDLFTKKSPVFDTRVHGNCILHSEYESTKANSYVMTLRDAKLKQLARMPYLISEVIDVAIDAKIESSSLFIYVLKHNKTVDVFRGDEGGAPFSFMGTINIASMCERAGFWANPNSYEMEFKVRDNKLIFKSAQRIWIFESNGESSDGPTIGSFSLCDDEPDKSMDVSENRRDVAGSSWWVNSRNQIIVHMDTQQKLVYFSLTGQILLERDLSDFPNSHKLSFCLDPDDNVFLYDNENIYT